MSLFSGHSDESTNSNKRRSPRMKDRLASSVPCYAASEAPGMTTCKWHRPGSQVVGHGVGARAGKGPWCGRRWRRRGRRRSRLGTRVEVQGWQQPGWLAAANAQWVMVGWVMVGWLGGWAEGGGWRRARLSCAACDAKRPQRPARMCMDGWRQPGRMAAAGLNGSSHRAVVDGWEDGRMGGRRWG